MRGNPLRSPQPPSPHQRRPGYPTIGPICKRHGWPDGGSSLGREEDGPAQTTRNDHDYGRPSKFSFFFAERCPTIEVPQPSGGSGRKATLATPSDPGAGPADDTS